MANFIIELSSQSHIVDGLTKYPYLDISDPEMSIIRPQIRSMEVALSMSEDMGTSNNTSRASRASNLSLIYSLFLVNFCL